MKSQHQRVLRRLLAAPTAPFHEQAVISEVRAWAQRRNIPFARDAAGNVLLRYRRGRSRRRWVFAAHLDHPGFVATAGQGRWVRADFFGGVGREFFVGSGVRFFTPAGEVRGRVTSARPVRDIRKLGYACRIELDRPAEAPAGTVGMWDLPAVRFRGRRVSARACEDLAGVAAALCAIGEIASAKIDADVTALLTRAEEAGFIGCLAACRDRSVDTDALIVAIEASQAGAGARLGDGVVVRVGDAVRTYDPALTGYVSAVAKDLARRDRHFNYVRQLMPGGICESTAYAAFGYAATGLCVPLGNYHNQGRGKIAPEQIDTGDFASLVKLLVAIAADGRGPGHTDAELKRWLDRTLRTRGARLESTPPAG